MKVELLSCHNVIETIDASKIDSIYCGKLTDPDLITVVLLGGVKLYCDELSFDNFG